MSEAYEFAEFLRDVDALEANGSFSADSLSFMRTMERVAEHFGATYPDGADWVDRINHFTRAISLLAHRLDVFDEAGLVVIGSRESGSLVTEALLRAVHEAAASELYWSFPPSAQDIAKRAKSYPASSAGARTLHIGAATMRLDFEEILRREEQRRIADSLTDEDQR